MKGPGFRLDLDVRRLWECPVCGKRQRSGGHVTRLDCDCRTAQPWQMRLVEPLRQTASPFDHVGHAAKKRIDAALIKPPQGPPEPPREPTCDTDDGPANPTPLGEATPGEPTGPPNA